MRNTKIRLYTTVLLSDGRIGHFIGANDGDAPPSAMVMLPHYVLVHVPQDEMRQAPEPETTDKYGDLFTSLLTRYRRSYRGRKDDDPEGHWRRGWPRNLRDGSV